MVFKLMVLWVLGGIFEEEKVVFVSVRGNGLLVFK